MQWQNRRLFVPWPWIVAAAVTLTGCGPEVTNLNTTTGGMSSSSGESSSGSSNTCVLGQSTVGNCVLRPE
ncbi:MAG TPA: hypothetical protein PK156_48255 [Polyangium sp.]|nr:hypothetical protein [Polyangium sp.]